MLLTDLPVVRNPIGKDIPEDKLVKVLLINPNASESMTLNAMKMVEGSLPVDAIVYGYTGPKGITPSTIEGHLDGVLSSAAVFKDVYPLMSQVDTALVACFSEHPLTNCLREEFDIPVCGIFEAGCYSARLIGGRFGVVATVYRSEIRHADSIKNLGIDKFCVGVLSTGLKVSELETKPRNEVLGKMENIAQELVGRGADALILGCCGMSDMKNAVESSVKDKKVMVIDGVVAGVNLLCGLVRSGLKTSKRGLFASSKDARVSRGQEYL
ncbi:protein Dcg1p [[Candida] jaroonii]|uniref:Protein Dcg1p n=1 Tax=[Candida] jaroonii TaxID=467808 RepID=A0ACA9Y9X0_9ASCO|nr:protein Dcg1p [[Candida] jaroonii]